MMATMKRGGSRVRMYPSQLDTGRYGHLICTPSSLLVTSAFICNEGWDPFQTLTNEFVSNALRASHALYSAEFAPHNDHWRVGSGREELVMIPELLRFIPQDKFLMLEVAGVLLPAPATGRFSTTTSSHDGGEEQRLLPPPQRGDGEESLGEEERLKCEDLHIAPLSTVVRDAFHAACKVRDKGGLVVTTGAHTVCFLFDGRGQRLSLFDPLKASLTETDVHDLESVIRGRGRGNWNQEYSGIIMFARHDRPK